jgi:hypothetical protein
LGKKVLYYWWREPQDVALELRSAAMPTVGAEDVHQFPNFKAGPPIENI